VTGSGRLSAGCPITSLGEFPFVDTAPLDALFDGGSDHRSGRAGHFTAAGPVESMTYFPYVDDLLLLRRHPDH
jgi:hypothetical protein